MSMNRSSCEIYGTQRLLTITRLCAAAICERKEEAWRRRIAGSSLSEQPCIDPLDGASYPVGETWIDADCMRCSCGVNTTECCTTYVRPVGYSEDCEAKFNCRECRYRVYRKDNPAIECEFSGAVGK
ncbi:beta-microseminoprotein-like isoform X2 [Hypanus sabinus]|uniref:beta-microseminoprotein-like isoform X2 n=1 Tax=Hypanus sabinus TaxID=79690 RepID=UPI0028C478C2|nr:beta-microseminoprotein-like isoform X2 [Hypanus sabinus]